ncbi:MAG: hypothetical protein J5642_02175 [Bacteroidales bacterium]|nr:hypothetical protein [Bacteroidales bacterium]
MKSSVASLRLLLLSLMMSTGFSLHAQQSENDSVPIRIPEDERVRVNGNLFGKKENLLYHFDRDRKKWYCIETPFEKITDILPYQQSRDTVMLADGCHFYLFAINEQTYTPFRYDHPLKDFLQYPVDFIRISATVTGCSGSVKDKIEYKRNGDMFVSQNNERECVSLWKHEENESDRVFKSFKKSFSAAELDSLLHHLDEQYDAGVSWEMFNITAADLDAMCMDLGGEASYGRYHLPDSTDLQWLADTILQVSDSLLTAIVMSPPRSYCTTTTKLLISFTNRQNQKLTIKSYDPSCSVGTIPYMLPAKGKCDGKTLYISCVPFMQFMASLMPDTMISRQKFNVHELLCKVGIYFWRKK